jgi:hypothetical protein
LILALLAAAAAPGCADSGSSGTATIDFRSPAVDATGDIRPAFDCGGGSLWLPLEWGVVPVGTRELAVYMGRYTYKDVDGERKLAITFGILVSKIKPSVHRIPRNTLPEGSTSSYFGQNCLPERNGQNILHVLFALDHTQPRELTKPLAIRLTEEALRFRDSAENLRSLGEGTLGRGQFTANYAR